MHGLAVGVKGICLAARDPRDVTGGTAERLDETNDTTVGTVERLDETDCTSVEASEQPHETNDTTVGTVEPLDETNDTSVEASKQPHETRTASVGEKCTKSCHFSATEVPAVSIRCQETPTQAATVSIRCQETPTQAATVSIRSEIVATELPQVRRAANRPWLATLRNTSRASIESVTWLHGQADAATGPGSGDGGPGRSSGSLGSGDSGPGSGDSGPGSDGRARAGLEIDRSEPQTRVWRSRGRAAAHRTHSGRPTSSRRNKEHHATPGTPAGNQVQPYTRQSRKHEHVRQADSGTKSPPKGDRSRQELLAREAVDLVHDEAAHGAHPRDGGDTENA